MDRQLIDENILTYSGTFDFDTWTIDGNPKATADNFYGADAGDLGGSVMSLSGNGQYLAIGSKNGALNKVVLLHWNIDINEWEGAGTNALLEGDSNFGASVQSNNEGSRLFVGAPGTATSTTSGKVYVYDYDDGSDTWVPFGDPLESDQTRDML